MKIRTLLIYSAISASLVAVAPSALAANLMQVYRQALKSDPAFQKAESVWESEKENLPIAWSGYLTHFDIQAHINRLDRRAKPVSQSFSFNGTINDYGYSLTLTQPILNAANWMAIKEARAAVKSATATYMAASQDLMVRTATAYFDVLTASEKLRFTLANKRAVLRQLDTAQQKFNVGLIAITGVYDAQSAYDQALANEIVDRNALYNRMEDLRAITGRHYYSLYGIKKQVPLLKPKPNNIFSWVKVAEKQNYDLEASHFAMLAAEQNIHKQRQSRYPVINGILNYDDAFQTGLAPPAGSFEVKTRFIGVSADFPAFQGGGIIARTHQARYDYLTASNVFVFTHRDVVNKTRQSFLGVVSGISRIKADAQTISSSQKKLEATEAGLSVGTRTMDDVLDSLATLYDAQNTYAEDQYTYLSEIIALKDAAGTLSARDLQQITGWLKKNTIFDLPRKYYRKNNNNNSAHHYVAMKSKKSVEKVTKLSQVKKSNRRTDTISKTGHKNIAKKHVHGKLLTKAKIKERFALPQPTETMRVSPKSSHIVVVANLFPVPRKTRH